MPRQAYFYIAVIILAGIGGLLMSASMLRYEKSWAGSLAKVKTSNEENAVQLATQRRELAARKAEVSQATLGWDLVWPNVGVTIDQRLGQLRLDIGTNNGVTTAGSALPVVHGFRQLGESYIYAGPFVAVSPPGPATMTVKPMWKPFPVAQGTDERQWGIETAKWQNGQWRFRSQIPGGDKRRFEALAARASASVVRFFEIKKSVFKQDGLLKSAEEQARLRQNELLGSDDEDIELDPLRPELKNGLVRAIEDEEEARNATQLEVDALRRAILEQNAERNSLKGSIETSAGATSGPTRISVRPNK